VTAVPSTLPAAGTAHAHPQVTDRGSALRAAIRIPLIMAWSGLSYLVWLVGRLLTTGSAARQLRWRHRFLRGWSRGVARLFGMRITITGRPPGAPFFLVSNHLSYMDIILLYTCLDCVFIAKQDMRRWPAIGFLAHAMSTIWVNRESRRDAVRVLHEIDRVVGNGDGVVLFPEGTTSAGDGMLPLKAALLDWAARREYPVHCAVIRYQTAAELPPAHLAVSWWGDMRFGPHAVALARLPGFDAEVTFLPSPVRAAERAALAEMAREQMLRHFVPMVPPERLTS
jgi:1-acyl-sn-glycerol-3-phosphate acyltransferase